MHEEIKVGWLDREPRYDGLVAYADGMTLIIENKLHHGDVWKDQLSPSGSSFPDGIDDVDLHPRAVCLEWSEVLEGVLRHTRSTLPAFGTASLAATSCPLQRNSSCSDALSNL